MPLGEFVKPAELAGLINSAYLMHFYCLVGIFVSEHYCLHTSGSGMILTPYGEFVKGGDSPPLCNSAYLQRATIAFFVSLYPSISATSFATNHGSQSTATVLTLFPSKLNSVIAFFS